MKKVLAFAAMAVLPTAIFAQTQLEPLPASPSASTDAATLGVTGDFRGVAVSELTGNVIVGADDDNAVLVLDPDLNLINIIQNADTGDGTVDPYRLRTSDDGQIYTQGFGGSVKRVGGEATQDASAMPIVIAGTGTCRGLEVEGSFKDGTVVIAVSKAPGEVLIYTQDGAAADTFTLADTVDTSAAGTSEVEGINFNADKTELYIWNNANNIHRYVGSVGGGWTLEADLGAGGFRAGFDYDEEDDYAVAALDSGSLSALLVDSISDLASTPTITTASNGYQLYPRAGNNLDGAAAINKLEDVAYVVGGNAVHRAGVYAADQVVTVDPSDPSPDYVSTFDSLMVAISSFQASGAVTTGTTVGGVGVNYNQPGKNVINVVNTGGKVDEAVSIDERTGPIQSIHTEPLIINGQGAIGTNEAVAPTAATNSVVALQADGVGNDFFEFRSDIDLTVNNITFIPSQTNPAGDDIITVDRLTASNGNPSTASFNSCVFTQYDGSYEPIVTSKTDAYTSKVASIATPVGDMDDCFVPFPGAGEGMVLNLNNCVLSHGPGDGIVEVSGEAAGPDGVKFNITSSVFTYLGRYAIQLSGTGNDALPTAYTCTISGTNAEDGPTTGLGGPTVITENLDRGMQTFFGAQQGKLVINETIAANNVVRQISTDGDLDVNMDGTLIYGPIPVVIDSWTAGQLTVWQNSTIVSPVAGQNVLFGDDSPATPTTTITDSVLASADGADLFDAFYSGAHSVLIEYTGIGTAQATAVADPGQFYGAGVFYADPAFVSTDWMSPDFLDVQNTEFAAAASGGGGLGGGADYVGGVTPAVVSVTPASVDFGTVLGGSTASDSSFVVENTGTGADALVELSISGPEAAFFSIIAPATTYAVIPAGDSISVEVEFAPAFPTNAYSASLDAGDPDAVESSTLTGTRDTTSVSDWMVIE